MTKQTPGIARLIDFHRLILQFQAVQRVVHLPDGNTENDAEHSYSLAMTAWFLCEHFPRLDRDKVIRYALAHDLVEVYAGDTHVFADAAWLASKQQREAAALKRLITEWPDFSEMTSSLEAYEARTDDEAKFVYALDKIMPLIAIFIAEGSTWQREGITIEQLHEVKRDKVKASPEINDYYEQLRELLKAHPHYFDAKA